MTLRLRRTDDIETVKALHTLCFPEDDWEKNDQHWLVFDENDSPVGFCSARRVSWDKSCIFLSRSGVLSHVKGQGLQRRMIHARLKWGREVGATDALTYTLYSNHASIVNLLKTGFRFFHPDYAWAGRDVHYFMRALN